MFWKSPQKLTGRTARWHEKLQDYNFKIVHVQGKTNTLADALSRPNGADITEDDRELALIPESAFLNMFDADSDGSLEQRIVDAQFRHKETMKQWTEQLPIHIIPKQEHRGWRTIATDKFVIPPNTEI